MNHKRKQHQKPVKPKTKRKSVINNLTFHKLDWLEWVALGLSLWFLVYPRPYIFLFSVLLFIPIIGLALNGLSRPSIASLVEITQDEDGDNKYDVADFIDFPAMVIFVRVLIDFEFEDFYSLILPGSIAFVIMMAILFVTHKLIAQSTKNRLWIYGSLLFNVGLYSYSGTYGANCVYDKSTPTIYQAEVINKRISRSRKHTSYYVRVTPWGHHRDTEEISVSRAHYDEIFIGQTVEIELRKGLFHIPWYYIKR